jgi:hypothetical protein
MFHLTLRVAWHDDRWNGTICRVPSRNSFCVALDRIREERNDDIEDAQALRERSWAKLQPDQLPPCIAESGGFMNKHEWRRTFRHPYSTYKKAAETHGHLKPTTVTIPPYATFAVPFWWMLQGNQEEIDESLPEPLPLDEKAGFSTPWVFGGERQEALCNLMFGRLTPERSLVLFYTKEGQPLGETISRLIVGVGRVVTVGPLLRYDSAKKTTYPFWDRVIRHSIRPDGEDGFLLPYHDYLEQTDDPHENERRIGLLAAIAVTVSSPHMRAFSYAAELASPDDALSMLQRCLESVRLIRAHGIAKGPWEQREEWLNCQIAATWKDRGAFPGLGSALEALGMRLGTALSLELIGSKAIGPDDDPWPVLDAILRGKRKPPQPAYAADLKAVQKTWDSLTKERRDLLKLLSRFDLTLAQAKRWFDPVIRAKATRCQVKDNEVLENPYRIAETDLGDREDLPVSVGIVDRGLLPESTVATRHPVPQPSAVGSPTDRRRIRAALVSTLRMASEDGDSLLSIAEAIEHLSTLDLSRDCLVSSDWVKANSDFLGEALQVLDVLVKADEGKHIETLQLNELKEREDKLRKILISRAAKTVAPVSADWPKLLKEAIGKLGGEFVHSNPRHVAALEEQAGALARITSRKLTALVGQAGTGKTSILGALLLCKPIVKEGVLLLAPTGKARVRLGKATDAEAMTIAQFLYGLERYDGIRQRPRFTGEEKHRKEKTVVIDECSMLTMDDLMAVLEALDLGHVQRLILVGDPNQLPPIGVGRPFADFVANLEQAEQSLDSEAQDLARALARLTVEVRTTQDTRSDTLRLASWFTRAPQPVDADRVLSDLELGEKFNDLQVCFWKTPEDLRTRLLEQFVKHLGLNSPDDVQGFNRALGFNEKGWIPFDAPQGVEKFQILSPVRMHPYGVHELNRWVQRKFRAAELKKAREQWATSLGDEEIVLWDKVIQVRNQTRKAYDGKEQIEVYLANGEIGTVAPGQGGWLNVVFAGRPNLRVGYGKWNFPEGQGPLELAYALTIHKSQGSEFRTVFVILPKNCGLISRELLYTALTRSRDRLVLLIEGDNVTPLYDFTRPERSETARRNTNLFRGSVREQMDMIPYADHLIHRTEKGHMVRSKSELVIANMLYRMGLQYEYERPLEGSATVGKLRPDFSFVDPAGDLILWEHLGMLGRQDYREGWEWKKGWYEKNGFVIGKNLFTSQDDLRGGLDSEMVRGTAEKIRALL